MIEFDLQRFSEVIHGSEDNDVLEFQDGRATLSGGAGNDTFSLTYSEDAPLEILIEDIDPNNDRLLVNYIGDEAANLSYTVKDHNVVLMDADGNLNITLQSLRPLDVYYDQVGNEYFWGVLRIVNEEREKVGAEPLTLSQELMNAAAIRAPELMEVYGHTRPDGTACWTALENIIGYRGENAYQSPPTPEDAMRGWMNFPGHRANILDENYTRLGVGYTYDSNAVWKHYWDQMFRGHDVSNETLSLDELLSTKVNLMINGAPEGDWTANDISPVPPAIDDDELIVTIGGVYDAGLGGAGFVLDTLVGDNRTAETFQYSGGDVLIENYSHDDTLELINSTIDSVTTDGGDLIFGTSAGSITLKNMVNHAITIKDAAGNTTTQLYGTGYTPQDVMKNYVQASARSMLRDLPAVDEAIKASSHFNSLQEVIDRMVSDCRNAGDADTFLRDYCGIVDDNGDTGAVVDWDAGGLTAKTSETILLEEGDAVYPTDTTFTIRGLTITVPERNTLTEQEQLVVRGFYSWWADNALRLIEESYGLKFDGQSIELMFINDDTASWGHGGSDGVTINMAKTSFDADDKNGNGLDRLFAHELTHVAQWVLDVSKGMPLKYMREGMGDLTAGKHKPLEIASDADSLAAYLDVNNDSLSGQNIYAAGYIFWRYYMKQTADSYDSLKAYAWSDNAVLEGTSEDELLTAAGEGLTINADAGNDTITAYGRNEMIDGGDGDDSIGNRGSDVTISGGTGNDTINRAALYQYTGGDDVITDYVEGDTIQLLNASSFTRRFNDGNDVILQLDDGSIRIQSGAWKSITMVDSEGAALALNTLVGSEGDDTASYSYDGVMISLGAGNDSLKNNGADVTLNAGAGNDTINHAAHYIYSLGDGNDLITNYSSDDTIHLLSVENTSSLVAGADAILKIGDGLITLKNAAAFALNVVDGNNSPITLSQPTVEGAINLGEGSYLFDESTGVTDDPIEVFYYRPATWTSGDSIAFVFHGMNRIAADYRQSWERYAAENNLLIICPEFTDEKYPGSRYYNTGNVTDNSGNLQPTEEWVFDVVDRIIVDVKQRTDSAGSKVLTFGHSAGAQMVHRYALFDEDSASNLIISANAGWYTMPDEEIRFPYGIGAVNFSDEQLKRAFAKTVVVMLGEEDTLRSDDLRMTAGADAQGLNRFERGQNFFETCKEKAAELNTPFNWQLVTVPNVGHSNSGTAQAAMKVYNDWLSGADEFDDDTTVSDDTTSIEPDDDTTSVEPIDDTTSIAPVDDTNSTTPVDDSDSDVFVYNMGDGRKVIGNKRDASTLYDAADKVVILGDEISRDDLRIKDKRNALIVSFKNEKDSRLTINKADALDAVQFYFGSDLNSALESDPFSYGATDEVTLNEKRTQVTVKPTVESATIDLSTISMTAKTLDGSAADSALYLIGNSQANVLIASEYGSTLEGGAGNDKLYGFMADVFVYSVGGGKDVIGNKKNFETLYDAIDKVVILGDGISRDDLILKDKRNAVNVAFKNDKKSRLTINRQSADYAVQFYFGSDVESALESDPFSYGATDAVTLNVKGTLVGVLPTVESATIDLSAISMTAKTLDGSSAGGELNLIGNNQANVLIASEYGSTLGGGAGNDKLYGDDGADVFLYDGAGNDAIYGYDSIDRIVFDGEFDDVKIKKRDVILKSGRTSLTIKDAVGVEIAVTDGNGLKSSYEFSRENNTLEKALISTNEK